ncbi:MAG: GIY-YIG nuclease family protein [Proteobacteria bacterium]|nr:GIY-YIG nuclease family protein [Pseudomonadota bacterium]
MLRCADDTFYTGITTDIERRLQEHNAGPRGAAYTRARRPVTLVYREDCTSRSAAAKREHAIRQFNRSRKESLISQGG